MNELQIFNNKEFGEIRVIQIDEKPWFVGKDVAGVLQYKDTFDALKKHVDVEDRQNRQNASFESPRGLTVINESGLYSLILSSKLPAAKKFKRWVTNEVLPSINKHGAYMTPQKIEEVLLNPDTIIKLATSLKTERELRVQAERQIAIDKPKVDFAEMVSESDGCISIANMAKLINQNGYYDMGQNRLFAWMRENGYLGKRRGLNWNSPSQVAVNSGWLKSKVAVIKFKDGSSKEEITPLITGKGQIHLINIFKKKAVR